MSSLSSAYKCPICFCPPSSPFAPPCHHVFCYECLFTHLETRSTCPLCAAYATPHNIAPAPSAPATPATPATPDPTTHTSSRRTAPPPLSRHPQLHVLSHSEASSDSRRARTKACVLTVLEGKEHEQQQQQARASEREREGVVGLSTEDDDEDAVADNHHGRGGEEELLMAGDRLSAERLSGIIQMLNRKLKEKEGGERRVESELLLRFLSHTKDEKERHIATLRRDLELLEGDVREAEGEMTKYSKNPASSLSSAVVGRKRRVDTYYPALHAHYFDLVGAARGIERRKRVRTFTDDVCKLTKYDRLRDRATLMHVARVPEAACSDVFRASNIVSSIEFDRESEFLATAGVTRRIKIFEFGNITRNLTDVHYPVREIPTSAKLSWVCWNPYIRHHLVSSDYEGFVTLWDVTQGTPLREYEEHESRAWSVDYCTAKPTLFASGSDDGRVKLWTTSQRSSVLTIDNKPANVCSVKFHPSVAEKLAFGSVDNNVHYYDLRNPREALQVFRSHTRAVSYVKFMSGNELVSASVDSTIKLWDLDTMSLARTFTGHANDKNFVGLSVSSDYIACGSEQNAVYCYYKAIPQPFTHYRFSTVDPLTGDELQDDDDSQFVSSVCWCPNNPELIVAANSLGSLKVLSLQRGEETESSTSTLE